MIKSINTLDIIDWWKTDYVYKLLPKIQKYKDNTILIYIKQNIHLPSIHNDFVVILTDVNVATMVARSAYDLR